MVRYISDVISRSQDCDAEMEIMKYTIQRGNEMFDVLYSHGVFLTPEAALRAGAAGMDLSETCLEFCIWGLIA